ncbi:hypothetical protein MTP99_018577 [Tenebrio molitor]|nr:hypothetical protein MTP99_018577 [Tenebrio molitor]
MSATIDQVRLRKNSPKNTKVRQRVKLYEAERQAANTIGVDKRRPMPHKWASIRGKRWRRCCATKLPAGTPMMPDTIDTTPNL